MIGTTPSRRLRLGYTTSMVAAVVGSLIGANLRGTSEQGAAWTIGLAALVAVLIALHFLPEAVGRGAASLSYSDLLRVFLLSSRESAVQTIAGRLLFLGLAPILLATIAIYDQHQYAIWFDLYLVLLALFGTLDMPEHDAVLTNLVASCGFIFLVSLDGGTVAIVLAGLATVCLLHAASAYLLMLAYPHLQAAPARQLSWLVIRRNLAVLGVAVVLATLGCLTLHLGLYRLLWWVFQPAVGRAVAEPAPPGLLEGWFSLILWMALTIAGIFFAARILGNLLRQRRAMKAGRLAGPLGSEADLLGSFRLFGMSREWDGDRRRIITAYLKTRNALGKLGYELRYSATPSEYLAFIARRLQAIGNDLGDLTELFLAARYARQAPSPEDAERASDLQHRILERVRRQ